jgi:arylsulfatase A-like enzyme
MTTDFGSAEPSSRARASQHPSRPFLARLSEGCVGATLGGLGAAAVEAHFAYHGTGGSASPLPLILSDAGLLAPLALFLGAGTAIAEAALLPSGLRAALADLAARFRGDSRARDAFAAGIVAGAPLGVLALATAAHVARGAFSSGAPPFSAGAVVAASVAALTACVATGVAAAVRVAHDAKHRWSSPVAWASAAAVFSALLLAWGIDSGTTNGDGGFLQILGVLRREELDLRGVALLGGIAAGAVAGLLFANRVPRVAGLVFSTAPLALTVYAATAGLEARPVALAVERGAPLSARPLALFRKLTDRDHDGASALFGGGDCDDRDPRRHPGADDVPGNGIDEDCSGADDTATPLVETKAAQNTAPESAAEWVRAHFPEGMNVVLVSVDTLRADLGYAGNPRPVSPNIDQLAAKSVVFDHAYSLASYTGKSVGPMLLGKYPSETQRTFDHFDRFLPGETFVQERLRRAGVRTLTAQAHWYFRPDTGIGRGFDDADYSAEPAVPQAEGDRTVNGDRLTDRALALLAKPENVSRRFYLWMHYVDVHAAYVPHPEFDFGSKSRDLYDGEIAFVDHHLGRLLAAIAASPFAGRTAIVLTSDHGEAFGEHGMLRHGREVWEELVHVPLLVFIPGVAPRHIPARRSAIDLVPTLLDCFGVSRPSGEGADFVSGQSLLPEIVTPGDSAPARDVLVDMSEGPYNEERQAFIDGSLKLVATNGRPIALFDLERDPGETRDLLGDADVLGPILRRFKAFRRTLRTVTPRR